MVLYALAATSIVDSSDGFSVVGRSPLVRSVSPVFDKPLRAVAAEVDCGCAPAPTQYSGKPSDIAKAQNPREILSSNTVLKLTGESVGMDEILKQPDSNTSLVVFLRSLG